MRMDPDAPLTAADVLNTYDERALARLLREFGEERFASRIASQIARRRASRPFSTTASWWNSCTRRFQRQPAGPAATRPSAHSRRYASPSMASWTRYVTRCPPRSSADAGRPDRGDGLPIFGGPHRQEPVRRGHRLQNATRPSGRIARARTRIRRLDPRRRARRAEEIARNPRSASVRLRALEKVGEPMKAKHKQAKRQQRHAG